MITSLGSSDTQLIWEGKVSRKLPQDIQRTARRKLRMIDAASIVSDLRVPPGNRLEALKGNLEGFYSIRINQQWRIIFKWESGNCNEVTIIDYH